MGQTTGEILGQDIDTGSTGQENGGGKDGESTLGIMLTEKQGGGKDGESQEIHPYSTEPSPLQS